MLICKAVGGLIVLTMAMLPAAAQENLGTSFGLPGNSPAVSWPHGLSLEALGGIDRLYPNGPEFGLANTSGGFGMIGSGRISAIGLVQNSVSPLVREELEHPFSNTKRLTDIFAGEAARSSNLFSTVLSGRFRLEVGQGLSDQPFESGAVRTESISMPSVDSVLKDQSVGVNSILKGSL
jgi:hypothetical protein